MQVNAINQQQNSTHFGVKLDTRNIRQLSKELKNIPGEENTLLKLLNALDERGYKKNRISIGDVYYKQEKYEGEVNGEIMEGINNHYFRDIEITNSLMPKASYVHQSHKLEQAPTIKETIEDFLKLNIYALDNQIFKNYITNYKAKNPDKSAVKHLSELVPDLKLNGASKESLKNNVQIARDVDFKKLSSVEDDVETLKRDINSKQKQLDDLQDYIFTESRQINQNSEKVLSDIYSDNPITDIDKIINQFS